MHARIAHVTIALYDWQRLLSSSFVHHKVSGSCISWAVWPGIAIFYTDIRADIVYSYIAWLLHYSLAISRRKLSWKKTVKMPPHDLGSIFPRMVWARITKFAALFFTISLTDLPDMTSLSASGIDYWCSWQIVEQFGPCLTRNQKILCGHPIRLSLWPHWI